MARREIPSPEPSKLGAGCTAALLLTFLGGVAIWISGRPSWWSIVGLFLAAPAVFALVAVLQRRLLLFRTRRQFLKNGKVGLLIHSDSPNWKAHIEERWYPRIGAHVYALNWSQNRQWATWSLAVRTFDEFVGRTYQFNPAVLVFRGDREPLVFRFHQAFRNAKHGHVEDLAQLEQQMFEALEQQANSALQPTPTRAT